MYHQLPHLKLTIVGGTMLSNIFGLPDTGSGSNLEKMEYQQSVSERHPNLVLKFAYLKYLDDVYTFNIIRVDGGKEIEGYNLLQ